MTANLATVWEAVADAVPERTALVQGDRRRTWRELDDRAARLAGALGAAGLEPDAKVATYLHNCAEYVEGVVAACKARAVPVNVNYRYLDDELAYLLDDADAEAVLFHGSLAGAVERVRSRSPKVRAWIQVDDGAPLLDGALDYEDVVAGHDPAPRVPRSPDDLLLLYTGGTTGMPKGVMWRAEDLFGTLAGAIYPLLGEATPGTVDEVGAVAARAVEAGTAPIHLPASPLMHGTGAFTTFQAMFLGGTVVLLASRRFDADELWETVQREGVSQMAIVGDAFARPMVDALDRAEAAGTPYDLSSLRLVVSSGVMWSQETKQALLRRGSFVCVDSVGSSEGIGYAGSMSVSGAEQATARFSVGEHARVLTDDGRDVEPGSGEIGMLAVGGHIPIGYYKDPEKSAATFREVGGRRWSVPGDWARVEADGTLVLLGRGSACINSGGEKVFPEEVEEAVKRHPDVTDCLVLGVPDERFGERVAAVVARRGGTTLTADDVVASLDGLARYKRPRDVVVVDEVRRGPNGKADYGWAREVATGSPAG